MPRFPKRPCRYPGCPNLCEWGVYCELHRKDNSTDAQRGGATARGYDSRWREARKLYLQRHPLCVECMKQGRYIKATDVDHIKPHRGDSVLFWDQSNWQALCKAHHDAKTGHGL